MTPDQARKNYEASMQRAKNQFIDNVLKLMDQQRQNIPAQYIGEDRGNIFQMVDRVKTNISNIRNQPMSMPRTYQRVMDLMKGIPNISRNFGPHFMISDVVPNAMDQSVSRLMDQAAMFGQIARQKPAQPSQQVSSKGTDVDQYAQALYKKWRHVFKKRDLNGYKRYIKWRMDNMKMNAKEAFDDLNRLWTKNYGGRSRQQSGKKPAEETAKPTEQKPATTEEAKPAEQKPEEPKLSGRARTEEEWMKELEAKGGTISDRELASLKSRLFGEATGVSLGRQPVGWRRAIEQFFNYEVGRIKPAYEARMLKELKAGGVDPKGNISVLASDYIGDALRQRMARVGLKGQDSIEQFVNNWNTYRWEYGAYKGIKQPRVTIDEQGRRRDQYFERRPQ